MANEPKKYTPEVERLLAASRGLYDCATRAKLTPGLALALRDGIPFDKLQIEEIAALARFCRELEKAGAEAKPEAPTAPADAPSGNGNGAAAGEIVSKADDKKPKGGKAGKAAESGT